MAPKVMASCLLLVVCLAVRATAGSGIDYNNPAPPLVQPPLVQLRVSKGLGTRPYNTVRVSVITYHNATPPADFDYSEPFRHRWPQYYLHSSLYTVPEKTALLSLPSLNATIPLPPMGHGVVGVLIADPCVRFSSITSVTACKYAEKFKTSERTPALLNAFVGGQGNNTDYWGILGDNFYDRTGETTHKIFEQLTLDTLSKPLVTVAGNHDYWILSPSVTLQGYDQYSNGFLQYYPMDTIAAKHAMPGVKGPTATPFNFSVDPDREERVEDRLPMIDNSIFYQQIGNVALIGFSGAYELNPILSRLREACHWLGSSKGIDVAVLLGHWDVGGLGADGDTATPGMYDHAKTLPGCADFDQRKRLKFVMGHTHCNIPHPHGHNDVGFMVAGQGMSGCGNYGIPLLDTTEERIRMWYFPVVEPKRFDRALAHRRDWPELEVWEEVDDKYDAVMGCLKKSSWRNCTHLAVLWLDQKLE